MSKKFRCGRLLLMKDGRTKKLDLSNGGGTRSCDWHDDQMTFDDVHNQLLKIFSFNDKKHVTSLYDFQYQQIDFKQFNTFGEYINKYGLNRNSTVVYLCAFEDDKISRRMEIPNNNNSPMAIKIESDVNQEEIHQSSSEYSFTNASNNLMRNIRELLNENSSNEISIQLFEYICVIHGYVFSIILPLQQQNEQLNELEVTVYLNNLNNISGIFESTKLLIHQNMNNFRDNPMFSTIRNSFFRFYDNVELLRNRWTNNVENNKMNNTSSSVILSDIKSIPEDHHERNLTESSSRRLRGSRKNKNVVLFKSLIKKFQALFHLAKSKRLVSFRGIILHIIKKLKSLQSNLNLSDESSLYYAKKVLLTTKNRFNRQFREQEIRLPKPHSDQTLDQSRKNILRAIRSTMTSVYRYQMKIHYDNPEKIPHSSSSNS